MSNGSAVLIVHGGAWAIPDTLASSSTEGVKNAALEGYKVLMSGGSALDAVETAVCSLENNPTFDAGNGSVLNEDGEVEMDAIIMEGSKLRSGAVAAIKNVPNPIKIARLVMEKTEHVLLVGEGANRFASKLGMGQVEFTTLVTEQALEEWQRFKKYPQTIETLFENRASGGHDTVGAVALDSSGHLAAATSTGGITAKMVGRVGDAPIIGCGAYCDDNTGAISCTGHGESILKTCLARHISGLLQQGKSSQQAVVEALDYMRARVNGYGGAIVTDKNGNVGLHFTTSRMAWAYIKNEVLHYGLNMYDDHQEPLSIP